MRLQMPAAAQGRPFGVAQLPAAPPPARHVADVPEASLSVLARKGRSFRLAGRLLPSLILAEAAELYALCRLVDDLADETDDRADARRRLVALRDALNAGSETHPEAARFLVLSRRHGLDLGAAVVLVETVLGDIGPVGLADEAALLRYAHGAAGTVGVMMCPILGASTGGAAPAAAALGVAMQLTNIARDVTEDAAQGRRYLPATWLPIGLGASDFDAAPEAVFQAVRRLLTIAEEHYRHAEAGYVYLPSRVRPAIRTAARLYREIGCRILCQGPAYLAAGRCVVPMPRRLWLLATSLAARP